MTLLDNEGEGAPIVAGPEPTLTLVANSMFEECSYHLSLRSAWIGAAARTFDWGAELPTDSSTDDRSRDGRRCSPMTC